MTLDQRIATVLAGPDGPDIAAFFDFDGTLIDGYSAGALYSHRLANGEIGVTELIRTIRAFAGETLSESEFEDLLEVGLAGWAGRTEEDIAELGERLFAQSIAGALFHDMWSLVKVHQNLGHRVVIATSATRMQVAPIARELGIDDVLCTELEVENGLMTGRVAGRTLWGPGKAAGVLAFAEREGLTLSDCYAYANGDEDIPFLTEVGHPCVVNPQSELAAHAAGLDWPTLELRTKPSRLDPTPALRTAAMYGTLLGASAAGIAVGLLSGRKRRGIDLATSMFAQVGSALGGVEVNIDGEANLWAHRPAVFLINHQSSLIDLVVTTTALRGGFTAVAKREAADIPVFGQLLKMADFAFVDRADSEQARDALAEAKERLASGVSVVIAPEGTRSFSPQIGRFRKGAFHLAMQAGVPIVPIVIRNAGELMWRNARTARPGRVDVIVRPPIQTAGWKKKDLDKAVVEVRAMYQETLENWPTGGAAVQAVDR
jgi:putative phosphoserine phosphatase/1-acylglycerol-3-phosphate O-acyltransferase